MGVWRRLTQRVFAHPSASVGHAPPDDNPDGSIHRSEFAGWLGWEPPHSAVRGESHYGPDLAKLAGPPREGGYTLPVVVTLRRDSANPHDSNAVRAEIGGRAVGYIAKEAAAELSRLMDDMGCAKCAVAGVIRGGSVVAPNLGVHLWPRRRLGPGPPLTALERMPVAPWPPRRADLQDDDPPGSAGTGDPVDRYYSLLKRMERAWDKLAFDEAVALCQQSIPLIPAVLGWDRSISGGEVRIRSIPAIENLCRAYAAHGDAEALQRLRREVGTLGGDLQPWLEDIDDAIEQAEVSRDIFALVRASPGFVQRNLSKEIRGAKGRGSTLCYWADQMGLLRREKVGASYALFPTERTP